MLGVFTRRMTPTVEPLPTASMRKAWTLLPMAAPLSNTVAPLIFAAVWVSTSDSAVIAALVVMLTTCPALNSASVSAPLALKLRLPPARRAEPAAMVMPALPRSSERSPAVDSTPVKMLPLPLPMPTVTPRLALRSLMLAAITSSVPAASAANVLPRLLQRRTAMVLAVRLVLPALIDTAPPVATLRSSVSKPSCTVPARLSMVTSPFRAWMRPNVMSPWARNSTLPALSVAVRAYPAMLSAALETRLNDWALKLPVSVKLPLADNVPLAVTGPRPSAPAAATSRLLTDCAANPRAFLSASCTSCAAATWTLPTKSFSATVPSRLANVMLVTALKLLLP